MKVAWQDLKDHFKLAGNVIRADVMTEPNGRSKGCGIVEFSTIDEARFAMDRLNNTELRGRLIFIREDRVATSNDRSFGGGYSGGNAMGRHVSAFGGGQPFMSNRIYVGNLAWDV